MFIKAFIIFSAMLFVHNLEAGDENQLIDGCNLVDGFISLGKIPTKELKTSRVTCQDAGSCTFHASLNALEYFGEKKEGTPLALSLEYLYAPIAAREMVKRSIRSALKGSTNFDPKELGIDEIHVDLQDLKPFIREFGVIPENIWQPKFRTESALANGAFLQLLKTKPDIGMSLISSQIKYKASLTNLMKKLKEANRPQNEITALGLGMRRYMSLYGQDFPKDLSDHAQSVASAEQLYQDSLRKALQLFWVIQPPREFSVDGVSYTPLNFAAKHFKNLEQTKIEHYSNEQVSFSGEHNNDIPLEQFSEIMRKSIDAGFPVQLGIEWPHEKFIKNGIVQNNFQVSEDTTGPHDVVIVGYKLSDSGTMGLWKIKNSHGIEAGIDGYFYVTHEYFLKHSTSVTLFR